MALFRFGRSAATRVARNPKARRDGLAPAATPAQLSSATAPWQRPLLPVRQNRTVAVLVDSASGANLLVRCVNGFREGDEVSLLVAPKSTKAATDPRLHATVLLKSADDEVDWFVQNGPVDVVVDLRGGQKETQRKRWNRLFLQLRSDGAWLVVRRSAQTDLRQTEKQWLTALARAADDEVVVDKNLDDECLRSVSSVTARKEVLILRKSRSHRVILRPGEELTTLKRRDPEIGVTTVTTLPPRVFTSPSTVVSHDSIVTHAGLQTMLNVPEMSLRRYTGKVVFGTKMLVYTPTTILNGSFRFFQSKHPSNPSAWSFTRRVARVKPPHDEPAECLAGQYYLVDPQFSGHFGHIMTEMIGRLWAWDDAKRDNPDLKVLLQPWRDSDSELERTLLNAYGIADEDIVLQERAAYVQELFVPTIMWHNWPPYFAHPELAQVWRRMTRNLVDDAVPHYDRIFVSRPGVLDRRRCRNAAAVERFFADRGFQIVYPELYDIRQQAAIFANATTIAGFAGSAMFNVLFAQQAETVIVLAQEAYTARNELLYATALGCDLHYFWSTPEMAQPTGGWQLTAYESEWSFDFDRNGADLAALLDELDAKRPLEHATSPG